MTAVGQAGKWGRATLPTATAALRMIMPPFLRHLVAVLLLCALPIGGAVAPAWAQSSPRGAQHDSFGRMVFDWPAPVQWSAETTADN